MILLRRVLGACAFVAIVSCIVACGAFSGVQKAKQKISAMNDLMQLGLIYREYYDTNKKGPANFQEFQQFANKKDPTAASVVNQAGPGGKYVLNWNVDFNKLPQGTSATVLGYESQVPSSGGLVLMADTFVKEMTAAEFAKANQPPKDGGAKDKK